MSMAAKAPSISLLSDAYDVEAGNLQFECTFQWQDTFCPHVVNLAMSLPFQYTRLSRRS